MTAALPVYDCEAPPCWEPVRFHGWQHPADILELETRAFNQATKKCMWRGGIHEYPPSFLVRQHDLALVFRSFPRKTLAGAPVRNQVANIKSHFSTSTSAMLVICIPDTFFKTKRRQEMNNIKARLFEGGQTRTQFEKRFFERYFDAISIPRSM